MKKFLAITLAVLASAVLFGCSKKEEVSEEKQVVTKAATQATTEVEDNYVEDPNAIKIVVNGNKLKTTSPPEEKKGTTMVPFRDIFNALGVPNENIKWDQKEKMIYAKNGENSVTLFIDQEIASGGGKSVELAVPPYVNSKGVTMVPARFIAEAMDAKVVWEGSTRTVNITTN